MSVGLRAARGAALSIMSSLGGRLIGLVSTLVLTRFLSQSDYGAVMVAIALVFTADELTQFGLLQNLVAKPHAGKDLVFHAAVYHVLIGLVVLSAVALAAEPLVAFFQDGGTEQAAVPTLFILVTCVSSLFDRVGAVPERILARQLRFGTISLAQASTEVVYASLAVALAISGFGGISMLYANVAQWLVFMCWMMVASNWRSWFKPVRPSWRVTRELFGFGLPLAIGQVAGFGSRQWDILLMARLFGKQTVARYNLAYRLAEIPATHIGIQIADVLLPSFAQMDDETRGDVLVRGTGLLALVVFPLAAGLSAIAPTVTGVFLDERWANVAPMLAVLAALSIFRPVGWTIGSFLTARHRPRTVMTLEVAKVVLLLASIVALAPFGELWACGAVGVAFGLYSLASAIVVRVTDRISLKELLGCLLGPLLACLPLVGGVLAARRLLVHIGVAGGWLALAIEIATGGLIYVPSALVLAPATSRNLLGLIKKIFMKGR